MVAKLGTEPLHFAKTKVFLQKMADFEGLLKKYKRTQTTYLVTLSQCRNYIHFDDPGPKDNVSMRMFATEEEAETFVRNSIVPMIEKHATWQRGNVVNQ